MDSDVHQIVSQVYEAKKNSKAADRLIEEYMPFIRSETAKFLKYPPDDSDDELSIAMFAFYEAIRNYSRLKGSFLKFAAMQIQHRLIDNYRKERRNQGHVSLDAPVSDDTEGISMLDTLQDTETPYEDMEIREATRQEIAHLPVEILRLALSAQCVAHQPNVFLEVDYVCADRAGLRGGRGVLLGGRLGL